MFLVCSYFLIYSLSSFLRYSVGSFICLTSEAAMLWEHIGQTVSPDSSKLQREIIRHERVKGEEIRLTSSLLLLKKCLTLDSQHCPGGAWGIKKNFHFPAKQRQSAPNVLARIVIGLKMAVNFTTLILVRVRVRIGGKNSFPYSNAHLRKRYFRCHATLPQ